VIHRLLGKRIATLRKARGLSQEELATMSKYSVEFISLVERGRNAPSIAGLERIAEALKVEAKDLLDFGSAAE
jgi:transcriptional regulator with XRE-family HTH domain